MEHRHISPQGGFVSPQNLASNLHSALPSFAPAQNAFPDGFGAAANPFLMSTIQQLSLGQNPFQFQPPCPTFGNQTLGPLPDMGFGYMQQNPWMAPQAFSQAQQMPKSHDLSMRARTETPQSCSMMQQPLASPRTQVAQSPHKAYSQPNQNFGLSSPSFCLSQSQESLLSEPPISKESVPSTSSGVPLFQPVDALEEALSSLSRDYNLDSDLGDVDEHLLRDAFFGSAAAPQPESSSAPSEGSLLHSIFEYDPAALAKNPEKTPPPVQVQAPSESVVTPKLREKIKMKREKELAEIDKAFERHLRSVAQKAAQPANLPPLPQLTTDFSDSQFASVPGPSSSHTSAPSPVRFSPVQFSPGSPSSDEPVVQRPSVQVFIPKEEKVGRNKKSNKVPIWKKAKNEPRKKDALHVVLPTSSGQDDEYSFTDEEEESQNDVLVDCLSDQRVEQEVARKLLQISSLHPELKPPVPAQPPPRPSEAQVSEELWRHVVPKKRHSTAVMLNERSRPSAPLLPPAAVELATKAQESQQCDPKPSQPLTLAQQLAQTLKLRRERRQKNCFVQTEVLWDDTTTAMPLPKPVVKQEVADVEETKMEPLLPKVIIRIPKVCIKREEPPQPEEKKKKKHHHKKVKLEMDENGEMVPRKKKKKRKKHKKGKHRDKRGSEGTASGSEDSSPEDARPGGSSAADPGKFSKKRRFMVGWTDGDKSDTQTERRTRPKLDYDQDDAIATDLRLSQFHQPTGQLQKGTFVVSKSDIGKSDCSIWRVDNQNLLQKFPPADRDGRIVYQSSSTYSGWCVQNAHQYLVLSVNYVVHNRSQCVVEPETPLIDLFPAVSHELQADSSSELLAANSLSPPECDQHLAAADQPLRDALDTYLHALLLHSLSGNFLQTIRHGNEWKFLGHMNDIDCLNQVKCGRLLKDSNWSSQFRSLVQEYPLCTLSDAEASCITCQACDAKPVERSVQLFANEGYDFDTMESRPPRQTPSGSPLPAQEYVVCGSCADVSLVYHRLYHMRYHMYKKCEERVEVIRDENPTSEPSHILELCLRRGWINQIVQEYLDLWRKVSDDGYIFQRL